MSLLIISGKLYPDSIFQEIARHIEGRVSTWYRSGFLRFFISPTPPIHTHTRTHTDTPSHSHMNTKMGHTHTHTHAHTLISTYTHTHTHTHTHTLMHTHIHSHRDPHGERFRIFIRIINLTDSGFFPILPLGLVLISLTGGWVD